MTKQYSVVYERTPRNWSAYPPDVNGCVATGKTRKGVGATIQSALRFHFEGVVVDGESLPEPSVEVGTVNVEIPSPEEAVAAVERNRGRPRRRRAKPSEAVAA